MTTIATASTCDGCGTQIEQRPTGARRRWCSDRCRKAQYSAPCEDCGTPLSGSDGRGPNAPRCCVACQGQRACDAAGRAGVALEMWRLREVEGLLNVEIAPLVHRTPNSVATELKRLRILGFAVPKAAYNGADKGSSTASHADESCATLLRELTKLGVHPPDTGLPWRSAAAS